MFASKLFSEEIKLYLPKIEKTKTVDAALNCVKLAPTFWGPRTKHITK